MPLIERPDITRKKRYTPPGIKLILLIAVLMGFWLRTCWFSKQEAYYVFDSIELENQTMSSVDVIFDVTNHTRMQKEISILIKLYTDRGDELASRLTNVEVQPRSKKRYTKTVEKWSRALYLDEKLTHATIETYKPSIF